MIKTTIAAVFALSLSVCAVEAQTCPTYPNPLTNGQPADATQVMANFNSIRDCVNSKLGREVLTANRTYFVRTDGNDSNNGLADTMGGAFLTIQRAINVTTTLDLAGFAVTIQVNCASAPCTFAGGVSVGVPFLGGLVTLRGNPTTPSNVTISTSGAPIQTSNYAVLNVQGFKLVSSAFSCLYANSGGVINVTGLMEFNACSVAAIHADIQSTINVNSNYNVTGAGSFHLLANHGGFVNTLNRTVTCSGALAFTNFAFGSRLGILYAQGMVFTSCGSVTGSRYSADLNALIFTNSGGASYFPGSTAGTTATGGQYN